MRLLRLHAPGTEPATSAALARAVADFNRSLDIRLRFLSIWIDERVLELPPDPALALEACDAALREGGVEVVLLVGSGESAVAVAGLVARHGAPLVRLGAGRRAGATADADRAVDRLATVHLVHGPEDASTLSAEGCEGVRIDVGGTGDAAMADRVVRALGRARQGGVRRGD